MGIKELIARFTEKARFSKEKYDEMEEDYRLQKRLTDRQKSSDERELEGYMEDGRKKRIKRMLESYRKRKMNEWWHGNNLLKQKNIFRNQKNLFKSSRCEVLQNG